MSEDTQAVETDAAKKPEQARGRSTIEFPYLDLSNAMEVAHAVKAVGGTSADWPQIAIKLSMQADGGAFRLRAPPCSTPYAGADTVAKSLDRSRAQDA